jgi:general secretion pathway protein M
MSRLTASASSFWGARNPRERRVLLIAGLLLGLALVWLWLIDPAIEGRARWQKNLPELRAQVAQLQALSREVAGAPKPTESKTAPLTRAALESSLVSKGLKPQNLTVTGELVRVNLPDASFAALIAWLGEMQNSAQLTVTEATVTKREQPDKVDANLSLRQQR